MLFFFYFQIKLCFVFQIIKLFYFILFFEIKTFIFILHRQNLILLSILNIFKDLFCNWRHIYRSGIRIKLANVSSFLFKNWFVWDKHRVTSLKFWRPVCLKAEFNSFTKFIMHLFCLIYFIKSLFSFFIWYIFLSTVIHNWFNLLVFRKVVIVNKRWGYWKFQYFFKLSCFLPRDQLNWVRKIR